MSIIENPKVDQKVITDEETEYGKARRLLEQKAITKMQEFSVPVPDDEDISQMTGRQLSDALLLDDEVLFRGQSTRHELISERIPDITIKQAHELLHNNREGENVSFEKQVEVANRVRKIIKK